MVRGKKIENAIMDVYREMYAVASPPADIDKIIKSGEGKEDRFFDKYYLDIDTQISIIDDVCKKAKLNGYNKRIVHMSVSLGSAPSSNKEKVNEYRKELNLNLI
jgi:hypothetical protein